MDPADLQHTVEVTQHKAGIIGSVASQFAEMRTLGITDGFIDKRSRVREISNVSSTWSAGREEA
jgi:hypothetical protein